MTSFVYIQLKPNLDTDVAVVIGQGNVAIDVARILLTPIDILKVCIYMAHVSLVLSTFVLDFFMVYALFMFVC